jgi:ferredoxin
MDAPKPPAYFPPFFTASLAGTGQQFDAWAHQPLLISAEQGGIDWPSSCRNGTCRTCIGQLAQGQVRYEMEWPGLSAEEKAQGCVLPCVAYPQSDLVMGLADA